MSDPFLAEIRMIGFTFPPRGWATCDGQLLPIAQNTALFSLIGTFYGGDGRTTFALPNMPAMMPMQAGQGNGLSNRAIGETGGAEGVQLTYDEMPQHTHDWRPSIESANLKAPSPARAYAAGSANTYSASPPDTIMAQEAVTKTGQSLPHTNMQPSLSVLFCIALEGEYPKRP